MQGYDDLIEGVSKNPNSWLSCHRGHCVTISSILDLIDSIILSAKTNINVFNLDCHGLCYKPSLPVREHLVISERVSCEVRQSEDLAKRPSPFRSSEFFVSRHFSRHTVDWRHYCLLYNSFSWEGIPVFHNISSMTKSHMAIILWLWETFLHNVLTHLVWIRMKK